ncbi:MAG: aminodeoxychorismate synthase component I [Bacteroidetes bacterium]|jgi:para-aminobenzoate synthetase/4-amino-4-deoxychorismate lyase|nr:aminodeoxychorismate synthase component I [Bacteroidota bacterium]
MDDDRLRTELEDDLRANGGILSMDGLRALDELDDIVLLETHRPNELGRTTYLFDTLEDVIWADRVHEVVPALVRAQMWIERGYYVAGYVGYEAAPAFLPVPGRDPVHGPTHLLWLGVYADPIVVPRTGTSVPMPPPSDGLTISELSPRIPRRAYREGFRRVRAYLERGHTYQVNYTFPLDGHFTGSSVELYARLRATQPVPYGAYIRHGDTAVISLSPELFVHIDGAHATLKPMKGTIRRGLRSAEDRELLDRLMASEKDRAENRMIVDLLRNDIGRLAKPGTVKVPAFFAVEQHPTVMQATSTITATLSGPMNLVDLFGALFPCGSVTGAPKIETMRIINEVEPGPRGVYTGAIGYFGPDGRGTFSVAIRTLVSDEEEGTFRVDVGSGVTIASPVEAEYDECLLKARFVESEPTDFRLFETILWRSHDGMEFLPTHLARLSDSASYFGWTFDLDALRRSLLEEADRIARERTADAPWRMRVELDRDGSWKVVSKPLDELPDMPRVGFARKKVSTEERFQYHKTTRRSFYDELLAKAERRGWFDVIALNERGEVAEGARSNVVIRRGESWLTPPISSGVLPGVYRAHLLRQRRPSVREEVLTPEDLRAADEAYVCNALRGLVRVSLEWKNV